MLQALELALTDDFDDRTAHLACADWLCEQGDPQGRLIQVQLELESPGLEPERLARLLAAEAELIREVYPLSTSMLFVHRLRFQRGWLTEANFDGLSPELIGALDSAPGTQLLRSLSVQRFQGDVRHVCERLLKTRFLPNLRRLALLDLYPMTWPVRTGLAGLLTRASRLEDLALGETNAIESFLHDLPAHVRTLRLRLRREEDLQGILLCKPLQTVEHLVLTAAHDGVSLLHAIDSGVLTRFFSPDRWPQLRQLELEGLVLGDRGCEALGQAAIIPQLRSLTLLKAGISTGLPLCRCRGIEQLELLDLGRQWTLQSSALRAACPGWRSYGLEVEHEALPDALE